MNLLMMNFLYLICHDIIGLIMVKIFNFLTNFSSNFQNGLSKIIKPVLDLGYDLI